MKRQILSTSTYPSLSYSLLRKLLVFFYVLVMSSLLSVAQSNCMISENDIYYVEANKLYKKNLIGSAAPVEVSTEYGVERIERIKGRIGVVYSEPATVAGIIVGGNVRNVNKEDYERQIRELASKNPDCERDLASEVKGKLIPLGKANYRNYAYVARLTGSAFKCDEPYEIHYDTGSWITTVPKVLLNMENITVIRENVNNGWPGVTCDLVKGNLALTSIDGTRYEIQDYPFYASKTYKNEEGMDVEIKSDIGLPTGIFTGTSIMGAFPSHFSQDGIPSLSYAIAKKFSVDNDVNFGFGIVYDCEPYLQIGPNPISVSDLKWRTDIPNWQKPQIIDNKYNLDGIPEEMGFNPEVIPGFKFKIDFSGSNKTIETSDDLLATIDTGAPVATLKLGPEDPQEKPELAEHFVDEGPYYNRDGSGNWTGWETYEGVKTLINANVTVEFTSSDCETFTYSYSVGDSPDAEPNSLYAAKWDSDAPWIVWKPQFPKNRINLGNTIYEHISIYYYDIENERVGFGFRNGVKRVSCKIADIEGNVYLTTKIGNQIWMAENLRTTKCSDGTSLEEFQISDSKYRPKVSTNAGYVWYNNDKTSEKSLKYGPVYTWAVGKGGCPVCPEGWRIPSSTDWAEFFSFSSQNHGAEGLRKPDSNWGSSKQTNSSGFSALPGGWLWGGRYSNVNYRSAWWAPKNGGPYYAKVGRGSEGFWQKEAANNDVLHIRCIKDVSVDLSQN
ncbi:MAG: FISUMP domain-containing protein [Bacteroidota bacterium]